MQLLLAGSRDLVVAAQFGNDINRWVGHVCVHARARVCVRMCVRALARVCVFELFVAARTRSFARKRRKKSWLRCAFQASPCARSAIVTIMITVMMNVMRVSCGLCVM